MEETVKNDLPAQASEESLEQQYSYVVHGALAYCPYGSRVGAVVVPKCHGTYLHDMPILQTTDSKAKEYEGDVAGAGANIQCFGFCGCMNNPDRLDVVEKIMEEVEGDKNLLDHIMDLDSGSKKAKKSVLKKIKGFFEKDSEEQEEDPYHGYSKDVYENAVVLCRPQFAVNDIWEGGNDRLIINEKQAMNSGCTIICLKGDGEPITFCDDGQNNAVEMQNASPAEKEQMAKNRVQDFMEKAQAAAEAEAQGNE